MIHKGVEIINQFAHYRRSMANIRDKYGINKGEFEILCGAYSLQSSKMPYFIIPDLIKQLGTMNKTKVYRYINELEKKGYISISLKTKKPSIANYYMVSGRGELILRRYIAIVNKLTQSNILDVHYTNVEGY